MQAHMGTVGSGELGHKNIPRSATAGEVATAEVHGAAELAGDYYVSVAINGDIEAFVVAGIPELH